MHQLTEEEESTLLKIEQLYYMPPVLGRLEQKIATYSQPIDGWKTVWNEVYSLLIASKSDVDLLLEQRKERGEIRDISQARKAVVGALFPNILIYIFLWNKKYQLIRPDIFITNNVKKKMFNSLTTIRVGDEVQKPDMDILIYSLKEGKLCNCIIVSLKTSLRERAGQTYKWKLLLEIAQSDNSIREKYDIEYQSPIRPIVCFATVNFYDEINNPQHRGMFKFFDKAFIGKQVTNRPNFIVPLSDIVDFVNQVL